MTRAAIYARVSSERQEREGSIASQIAELEARAKADGHVITAADVYADDGVSGSTVNVTRAQAFFKMLIGRGFPVNFL